MKTLKILLDQWILVNIGAGYNFTDNLAVGLRYTIGLSPLTDEDVDNTDDYYDSAKNSNLALSLSYKF